MNYEPDSVESKLIQGRGATSCLMCNKVCEHIVINDLDIIYGVKMLYETDQYNIMLQSSIICIKCKGRMFQIFDFDVIKRNLDDENASLPQCNNEAKCNFCNDPGFMKGNFRVEAQRAMENTKWREAGTSDLNENCCFSCYNYLLLYKKFKGILERECVEFYRKIKSWRIRIDEIENIEELRSEFTNLTKSRVLTQQTQEADSKSKVERNRRAGSRNSNVDQEKEKNEKSPQAKPARTVNAIMLKRLKMSDFNENAIDVLNDEDKFSLIKKRRSTERHNIPVQQKRRKNASGSIKDESSIPENRVMVTIPLSINELTSPVSQQLQMPISLEDQPITPVENFTTLQNEVLQEKNLETQGEEPKEQTGLDEVLVTVPSELTVQEDDTLKDSEYTEESISIPNACNDVEEKSARNHGLIDNTTSAKVTVESIETAEFSSKKVFPALDLSDEPMFREASNLLVSTFEDVAPEIPDVALMVTLELIEPTEKGAPDKEFGTLGQYFGSFMTDLFPELEDVDVGVPPKCPKTQEDYVKQFGLKELSITLTRVSEEALQKILRKRAPKTPKHKTSIVTKSGRICKPKHQADQGFVSKVKLPRFKAPSRPSSQSKPRSRNTSVARFEAEPGPDKEPESSSMIEPMELSDFLSEYSDISIGYVDYVNEINEDDNVTVEGPHEESFEHVNSYGNVHEDIPTVEIIEVENGVTQPDRFVEERNYTHSASPRRPRKLKQNVVVEFLSPDRQGQGKLLIDGNHVRLIPRESHSKIKQYRNNLVRTN